MVVVDGCGLLRDFSRWYHVLVNRLMVVACGCRKICEFSG